MNEDMELMLQVLFVALLAGPALSLTCYKCSGLTSWNSCPANQVNSCTSTSEFCGAVAVLLQTNSGNVTNYIRSCLQPSLCNTQMSLSIGQLSATFNSVCCTIDSCNTNTPTVFTPTTSGPLQCYAGVNQQTQVTCRDTEDRCFTVSVQKVATITGCASQSACNNMAYIGAYLGVPSSATASCCTGPLCNQATPGSNSLVCYNCTSSSPGLCTAQPTICDPSSTACMSFALQVVDNGTSSTVYDQSCAYPGICNSSFSFNFGVLSANVNAQCCTTSLCKPVNSVTVSPQTLNSLTCYFGVNGTLNGTIQCKGSETLCFTIGLKSRGMVRGCASQSVCDNYETVIGFFGDAPTTKPTCCSGNLCNSSWRPRWSPILYLLVLTAVTFFY